MRKIIKRSIRVKTGFTGGLFLASLFFASGCAIMNTAANSVAPGMEVAVDYTCLLHDGKLAATTLADAAEEYKNSAAAIFQPAPVYQPVIMKAEFVPECLECNKKDRSFALVLRENIQNQLAGAHYGQTMAMTIRTDELILDESEGQISIRRHQTRPKIKPVMLEQIVSYLGRKPEVGEIIAPPNENDWPVKVLEIGEEHAVIELQPDSEKLWHTPFGLADFADAGDEYLLSINPEIGHLVRSGGLVGRVAHITNDSITLDYRHPFGYEELTCEVTVHDVHENAEDKHAAAERK